MCGPVAGGGARHVGGDGDESVREVPGEHLQQEQMSELLQVAGVTSARRPGHGAGNGRRELSPRRTSAAETSAFIQKLRQQTIYGIRVVLFFCFFTSVNRFFLPLRYLTLQHP